MSSLLMCKLLSHSVEDYDRLQMNLIKANPVKAGDAKLQGLPVYDGCQPVTVYIESATLL